MARIHWQRVPLRDAVARLESVFDESVFLDRRVDPSQRVNLDVEADGIDDVLNMVATQHGLGISRLGRLAYLGPRNASEQLPALAALRLEDAKQLAASQRATLERKRPVHWPRLAEPGGIVASLVEQSGWRLGKAERIPHDLWPAGHLPELTLAEQLTVLLIGFDLTFELRPRERTLVVVPLEPAKLPGLAAGGEPQPMGDLDGTETRSGKAPRKTRQVYTLRVAEQPVRAVLQELVRRLNWKIEFDERAIRAAGRSVDSRVSFAVENVGQEQLLEALLHPAGLAFRHDGERIVIVPREAN